MTITMSEAIIVAAAIAATGSIITAVIALVNKSKLDVIHVLVNSNLDTIRKRLDETVTELETALREKDAAVGEVSKLRGRKE